MTEVLAWYTDAREYRRELREIEEAERQAEKELQKESQKWGRVNHYETATLQNQ